jgi:hypothetical protein
MDPRVYLQIAVVLRGKPQLHSAVAADMSDRGIAGSVFHGNFEQPLVKRPLADLASTSH